MQYVAFLYLISIMTVPASMFLRPEYVIAGMVALGGTLFSRKPFVAAFRVEYVVLFALTIAATITVLIQTVLGPELIYRDLMIIARYGYYGCALATGALLAGDEFIERYLKLVVLALSLFAITLSAVQYFNIMGLNAWLVPTYGAKYGTLLEGASWRRTIGTFGNANYWGLFVAFLLLFHCYQLFWEGRKRWLFTAIMLFWVLILTGSRSALLAVVGSCFFSGYLLAARAKKWPKFGHVAIVLVASALIFVYSQIGSLYENQGRFSIDNLKTLTLRIEYWKAILSDLSESSYEVVVGRGPTKVESIRFGDNMYIRMLRDYGVLGLGVYLLLIGRLIFSTLTVFSSAKGEHREAAGFLLLVLIALFIFDGAADAWFDVRIMGLVLYIYGAVHFNCSGFNRDRQLTHG